MSGQRSVRTDRWTFPDVLRSARGGQGWTQTQLAEAIGVGVATVGRWERGESRPHQHLLRAVAQALEIDEGHLRASLSDDVAVGTVTTLTSVRPTATDVATAGDDLGTGGEAAAAVSRTDRFADIVMHGLARGDGTDVMWTHNVANLARLIGVQWAPPPSGRGE